ncbi:proline-rich protein 29 isoform X2 [Ascaphus truei]|uniref:proline-rich protein 29 isoform X2 n=1 Tax=Ascaphus truei TaxID=8439 RepID=UPI003F59CF92
MSHGWPAESAPYCSPSWEGNYPGVQIIPAPVSNQPTIIQQIPAAFAPLSQPIRHGRAKEDLIELMMIQNAQMHQVIMNNMAVSAMSSLGSNSAPAPATPSMVPVIHMEEEEEEEEEPPVIYHHHYDPYPPSYPSYPSYPVWQTQPQPRIQPREPTVRHINMDMQPTSSTRYGDQRAVPPPPPPSATGTVGADVLPASEYYDFADGKM